MERAVKTTVVLPKERFRHSFKIRALAASECPAFFPADIIEMQNTVHIRYSTAGYRPLARCSNLGPVPALMLLQDVIRNAEAACDWMWFPEDYVISCNTVWINSRGKVRMMCLPDQSPQPYFRRMQSFLHDLEKVTEPPVHSLLQSLQKMAGERTMQSSMLLSEIDQLLAEVQSYL